MPNFLKRKKKINNPSNLSSISNNITNTNNNITNDPSFKDCCNKTVYYTEAFSTASITTYGGSIVNSSSSATAESTISFQDAQNEAQNIANQLAIQNAQHDSNVIYQAVMLSIQAIENMGFTGGTGPTGYTGPSGNSGDQYLTQTTTNTVVINNCFEVFIIADFSVLFINLLNIIELLINFDQLS